MNIAVVNLSSGGILRYGFSYASGLASVCSEPVYLVIDEAQEETYSAYVAANGISETNIRIIGISGGSALTRFINLLKALKRLEIDVVHDTAGTSSGMSVWVCFVTVFFRLFVTLHDPKPHEGTVYTFAARLKRFAIKVMADKIVVHGASNYQQAVEGLGCKQGKMIVSQHGSVARDISDKNRFSAGEIKLLFFGNLRPDKGIELLSSIADSLESMSPDRKFIFTIAGRSKLGPYFQKNGWQKRLNELLESYKQRSNFHVIDEFISDQAMQKLFHETDIILLPYKDASQSGVLCDAVGFGKYIVSTSVGGLGDVLVDKESAMLCDYDADQFAAAILSLSESQELQARLKQGVSNLLGTVLSWSEIARKMLSQYSQP